VGLSVNLDTLKNVVDVLLLQSFFIKDKLNFLDFIFQKYSHVDGFDKLWDVNLQLAELFATNFSPTPQALAVGRELLHGGKVPIKVEELRLV